MPALEVLDKKALPETRYLSRKQALAYLGVSSFTLWKCTRSKSIAEHIPSYKFGKSRKYRREDLDWWAEKHRA